MVFSTGARTLSSIHSWECASSDAVEHTPGTIGHALRESSQVYVLKRFSLDRKALFFSCVPASCAKAKDLYVSDLRYGLKISEPYS